jgi:hypothetical protein
MIGKKPDVNEGSIFQGEHQHDNEDDQPYYP